VCLGVLFSWSDFPPLRRHWIKAIGLTTCLPNAGLSLTLASSPAQQHKLSPPAACLAPPSSLPKLARQALSYILKSEAARLRPGHSIDCPAPSLKLNQSINQGGQAEPPHARPAKAAAPVLFISALNQQFADSSGRLLGAICGTLACSARELALKLHVRTLPGCSELWANHRGA
jgi:hypothetical protein